MTPEPALAHLDGPIHRVGRRPDAWAWPTGPYAHDDGTFGNRYYDPQAEYRVLYASSTRAGAFAETLARFRPDLEIAAELSLIASDAEDDRYAGSIPSGRRLGNGSTPAPSAAPRTAAHSSMSGTPRRSLTSGPTSPRASCTTASTTSTPASCGGARRAPSPRRSPATCSSERATRRASRSQACATSRASATSSSTGRSSRPRRQPAPRSKPIAEDDSDLVSVFARFGLTWN